MPVRHRRRPDPGLGLCSVMVGRIRRERRKVAVGAILRAAPATRRSLIAVVRSAPAARRSLAGVVRCALAPSLPFPPPHGNPVPWLWEARPRLFFRYRDSRDFFRGLRRVHLGCTSSLRGAPSSLRDAAMPVRGCALRIRSGRERSRGPRRRSPGPEEISRYPNQRRRGSRRIFAARVTELASTHRAFAARQGLEVIRSPRVETLGWPPLSLRDG